MQIDLDLQHLDDKVWIKKNSVRRPFVEVDPVEGKSPPLALSLAHSHISDERNRKNTSKLEFIPGRDDERYVRSSGIFLALVQAGADRIKHKVL